ncbi:MAG: endonuclease domain-containing protein [Deltaproteobacteria bacterium]|nr:endonuclease domain-containing protein [Deltaproteobacteria bacterium]MBN2671222.1 endonuclease domain-containing protein [Deltaproteobacteria bacterium]
MLPYKKSLRSHSRKLHSSMTDAECAVWAKLRRKQLLGLQFYRQKTLGSYIVDFYCAAARLVVEVDGGQHYQTEGAAIDAARDCYLKSLGLDVLRFSNLEVLQNNESLIYPHGSRIGSIFLFSFHIAPRTSWPIRPFYGGRRAMDPIFQLVRTVPLPVDIFGPSMYCSGQAPHPGNFPWRARAATLSQHSPGAAALECFSHPNVLIREGSLSKCTF